LGSGSGGYDLADDPYLKLLLLLMMMMLMLLCVLYVAGIDHQELDFSIGPACKVPSDVCCC
jgi:hypothetical protein